MSDWNDDMSQAPKDGTEIIAWCGNYGVAICHWSETGQWCDMAGYSRIQATHWMPLPTPPEATP